MPDLRSTPAPPVSPPPIVFLHLPKTAGQSIHAALSQAVGLRNTSPQRHPRGHAAHFPDGFKLYSGHLDWANYPAIAPRPFAFTVLRDPLERLASLYLYLRARAFALDPVEAASPDNIGLVRLRELPVDTYFFGGPPAWQRFIRDSYANPFCRYLATGRFRGTAPAPLLRAAMAGLRGFSGVYHCDDLTALSRDLARETGLSIPFDKRLNQGTTQGLGLRWLQLSDLVKNPGVMARLGEMVVTDQKLVRRLWPDLAAPAPHKPRVPRDPPKRGDGQGKSGRATGFARNAANRTQPLA